MTSSDEIVFVVDDDESICTALKRLLKSAGHKVITFSCAEDFFEHDHCFDVSGCLVLDIQMPGLSGLELQDQMAVAGISIPIIFITGHGNVPTSVRALKAGAVDFLEKPFDDLVLLDTIHQAIAKDTRAKQAQSKIKAINQRV
jgi:two-component system response regulator FixJ